MTAAKTALKNSKKPVIVTGLSGAGLSSVLKNLEDLGFEVFDNFPLSLVKPLLSQSEKTARLAIGIDARTRGFAPDRVLKACRDIDALLVFVTCDNAVLQKRFTETRRRHPLAENEPARAGIKKERALLAPLQTGSDLTIDTSDLSVHDLRHILEGHFGAAKSSTLTLSLMSFGFRYGLPREADLVMDVRFLQNPNWEKTLKPKTGLDQAVGKYIEADPEFDGFMKRFKALLKPLLPRYAREGKSYLTIAIGCTGGRHRSVYTTEQLARWMESLNIPTHVSHRDLKK